MKPQRNRVQPTEELSGVQELRRWLRIFAPYDTDEEQLAWHLAFARIPAIKRQLDREAMDWGFASYAHYLEWLKEECGGEIPPLEL